MRDDPARRVADELRRRGLAPAARLLIDAHRPLSPLLADVEAALGPLVGAIGGRGIQPALARLVEPDGLDRLVAELGDHEERDAEPG